MIDFISVAEDFQTILNSANSVEDFYSFNEQDIQNMKSSIKMSGYRPIRNIDYNLYGRTFNAAYYQKNLLKNLLFFREIIEYLPHDELSIRDIGCGAAPSSSALSLLYRKQYKKDVMIDLIDLSKQQLEFAIAILRSINSKINSISIKNYDINTDSLFCGLSVYSYFLCEQDYNVGKALYQNRNNMEEGFAVIDYKCTIDEILSVFINEGDNNLIVIDKSYSIPEELIKLFGYPEITVHGCYYQT